MKKLVIITGIALTLMLTTGCKQDSLTQSIATTSRFIDTGDTYEINHGTTAVIYDSVTHLVYLSSRSNGLSPFMSTVNTQYTLEEYNKTK